MADILPSEAGYWQRLEATAREVLADYGYEELRVPVVEHTELYKRSIGEFTDIVRLEARYRSNGLNGWERADLSRRLDRLDAMLTAEMRDRNNRRG